MPGTTAPGTPLPSAPQRLGSRDVHVWGAWLDDPAWPVPRLAAALSADERARADAYAFDRDRRRFVVRRGLLRLLLSAHMDVPPNVVTFAYGSAGKPQIRTDGSPLHVSCSHSQGLALYGFTRCGGIGVDIEALRPVPDLDAMAELCCSPPEHRALGAVAEADRSRVFLTLWTRKEAFVKAVGEGLSRPLDCLQVGIGDPPTLVVDGAPAAGWSLRTVVVPDAVAAVAVEARQPTIGGVRWVRPDRIDPPPGALRAYGAPPHDAASASPAADHRSVSI